MKLKDGIHLTYCTNIHPGEDWNTTFDNLKTHLLEVKKKCAPHSSFGIGLRLSNQASEELGLDQNLSSLKIWLEENNCYVFTINGFPYGNFHRTRVKDKVHAPDWTTTERVSYTIRLFRQLKGLLTPGVDGGISTSPISYKHWHNTNVEEIFRKGAQNMIEVAFELYQIEKRTGCYLHLDVEPEPDGLLENTQDVLSFFNNHLIPEAKLFFGKKGILAEKVDHMVKRYITLCYDVCHFSMAYEEPKNTFETLKENGIKIGKIQISAALKIHFTEKQNQSVWEALKAYNEPVYLHQVTERKDGAVKTFSDLPEIFSSKSNFEELRAHFHVPIFLERFGVLESTQDQILKTMEYLSTHENLTTHLEVETYTWEVLPQSVKLPLVDSIVRELNWVKDTLI
ncbi:MAG: metabolite traffic protein EboE [Croceivirga sp.]